MWALHLMLMHDGCRLCTSMCILSINLRRFAVFLNFADFCMQLLSTCVRFLILSKDCKLLSNVTPSVSYRQLQQSL